MQFTLSEAVTQAKAILGQSGGDESRYPSSRLVMFGNAALQRLVELYPDLFTVQEWMTLADGVEQTVPFSLDCRKLRGVLHFRKNNATMAARPLDTTALDVWRPGWRSEPAGMPSQVAAIPGRVDAFFCYPPADSSVEARVSIVRAPLTFGASQAIPLPTSLVPAIADYMAGMAEMADEEHVNSTRAAQLLTAFVQATGAMTGAKPA